MCFYLHHRKPILQSEVIIMRMQTVDSSMRVAFESAIMRIRNGNKTSSIIRDVGNRGVGILKRPEWNAHLSKRTVEKLGLPLCVMPKARMAYDDMCA